MQTRPALYLVRPPKRRRLRDDLQAVGDWLHRYAAPGWLIVLAVLMVWGIAWVNAANALERACGK